MKEIKIESFDKKQLHTYVWDQVNKPLGIIHLVHGSAEHSLRYENFVNYLNKNGWIVVSSDHRGHGKTASIEDSELGYFADENGWETIINDLKIINDYISKKYEKHKIVIIGHSMGSFMARSYISKYGETIDGAILVGTAIYSNFILNFGKSFATKNQKKYGSKYIDKFVWKLSYKPLNNKFKKFGKTGAEWLCSDQEVVKNFVNDQLSGQIFTSSAFKDLFTGLLEIQTDESISKIPKNLPIFIISGKEDSVGNFGKGPQKLQKLYLKNNLNSKIRLYLNMRHEILNEVKKEMVWRDVLDFLSEIYKKQTKLLPKKVV
ncbi:lysophospholipase [Spiroplasma helicoides]|uniref:Lysophospholipase n=1 Tax=Spiroplasma helicoides TaxID=216938 RepID=A0A1B3SKW0_9MOLU|nr:alpha/beta fold hydrolase [Spiroplasma helicoides]AOG60572.1 lysophospholipase [Spiroplasma helicoides]